MYDVSGLYPAQQSLVIGSYAEMLMREVLSDRYRITQEKFQYRGVEICMTFQAYALYQMGVCLMMFGSIQNITSNPILMFV